MHPTAVSRLAAASPTVRGLAGPSVVQQPGTTTFGWDILSAMWAAYYVAVLTIGRYEEYTRWTAWLGGGIATLLTLPALVKSKRRLPVGGWLLVVTWLWSLSGAYLIKDWPSYFRHLQMLTQMVVIVLCVATVLRHSGRTNWMYLGFLLVCVFMVVFGLEGVSTAYLDADSPDAIRRSAGLARNSNSLGFYCFLGMLGGLGLLGDKRSLLIRGPIAIGVFLAIYGVLSSASRGAFLVMMLALVLWAVLCFRTKATNKMLLLASVLLVVLLTFALGRYVLQSTYLGERVSRGIALEDRSARTRMELMQTALDLMLENPFHGVGLGQFAYASGYGYYAHSEVAQLGADGGLIGLCVHLAVYAVTWRRLSRALRRSQNNRTKYHANLARIMVLVLVFAGSFFRPNYLSFETMFLTAIAIGVAEWANDQTTEDVRVARWPARQHSRSSYAAMTRASSMTVQQP